MRYLLSSVLFVLFCTSFLACGGPQSQEPVPDAAGKTEISKPDASTPTEAGNSEKIADTEDAGPAEKRKICAPGTAACRCLPTGGCNTGLRCEGGVCEDCPAGSAGCACQKSNKCNAGLKCEAGVCKGCVGKAHCPCFGNNSCESGNRCEVSQSGAAVCKPCSGDKAQCSCKSDADCGSLACVNMRCQDLAKVNKVPKNPVCYSPCDGDVQNSDGTIRICDTKYQLTKGCGIGQTCHEGSCVPTPKVNKLVSSDYPFCMESADCPSWQVCLSGRCYSTCSSSSQCSDGFTCYSYVCRRKCNLRTSPCSGKETCLSLNSQDDDGICMPRASRSMNPGKKTQVQTVFELFPREIIQTNHDKGGIFVLTNKSAFATKYTISRGSDNLGTKTPLSWLKLDLCKTYNKDRSDCTAFEGKATAKDPFTVEVPGKQRVIIQISNINGQPKTVAAYRGMFRVKSDEVEQLLSFVYRKSGNARWKGKLYSFGNFDDNGIDKFPAPLSVKIRDLSNAFLRRWLNFKRNEINFDQFRALLRSMQEGTWRLPLVVKNCKTAYSQQTTEDVLCYPYSNSKGYMIFSYSNREATVPTGLSSLDLVMDLKNGSGNSLEGRIVTSESLQYPGDPKVTMQFSSVPGQSEKTLLTSMKATIDMGGRYNVEANESCADGKNNELVSVPWILPDFLGGSTATKGLLRERYECRNKTVPLAIPAGATAKQRQAIEQLNLSLSGANPVPNGRTLRRTIELVDGLLYKNRYLFAIVKERFVSFFPPKQGSVLSKDLVRYGYIFMERSLDEIDAKSTVGNAPPKSSCASNSQCKTGEICSGGICQPNNLMKQVVCSPNIVRKALGSSITKSSEILRWGTGNLDKLTTALILGQTSADASNTSNLIPRVTNSDKTIQYSYKSNVTGKTHYIHYFCGDTGQFNGGPVGSETNCPLGSQVIFFESTVSEKQIRADACQVAKTCAARLKQLSTDKGYRTNVPFRCKDAKSEFCDNNRKDLREGKVFFRPFAQSKKLSELTPLRNAIRQAFRYRFKFQSRSGKNIGFAPVICQPGTSTQTPYCYEPKAIEEIEERVNCLEYIYASNNLRNKLSKTTNALLKSTLVHTFSYSNYLLSDGTQGTYLGFEVLNAELRIMMGDEAYTKALGSRYDLANSSLITFPGDKLEPNGIILSGVLGNEMYHLYLAVQYYQSVLDRFYSQSEVLAASFASADTTFLTWRSVTSFVEKILVAATRKTRAWSEIATRYHTMNKADLAKHVLERTYTSTYIEMMVLTSLLRSLILVTDRKRLANIQKSIERVSLTYNAALLDMQETYKKLSNNLNYFGFSADYIPFPAVDSRSLLTGRVNAFDLALAFTKQKVQIAAQKEQSALSNTRNYETSSAQFQSELVKINNNYDSQLIQICGGIKVGDRVVPAIPRFASVDPKALQSGDPCGRVPGGQLYNSYAILQKTATEALRMEQTQKRMAQRILEEENRIKTFCKSQFDLSEITWKVKENVRTLRKKLSETTIIRDAVMRTAMGMIGIAMGNKCTELFGGTFGGDCINSRFSTAAKISVLLAQEATVTTLTIKQKNAQSELQVLSNKFVRSRIQVACNVCPPENPKCGKAGVARIASQNRLTKLTLDLQAYVLQALRSQYNMRIAYSGIERLRNKAKRLIREQEESLAMLSEVNAAANDPNQRIYKNDTVIAAERTFDDALKEAYRLTLLYEYYTGQTYKRKGNLYLVRMIGKGDISLESYVSRLEQAYRDFGESNGKPDLRVAVISLRDDVMKIARKDKAGRPLTLTERVAEFQRRMTDRNNLNQEGYTSFSFNLSVTGDSSIVSPITFNHKLMYLEAEVVGGEIGDSVGRVYVRQKGTGVVRLSGTDEYKFYALPTRTAVVNPYFNGTKVFAHEIYRNFRLSDRPLGNTQWEIMFNQSTEKSNQDINLNSVNDIRIYVFYNDFTKN